MNVIDQIVARGMLPTPLIRFGIRKLLKMRQHELKNEKATIDAAKIRKIYGQGPIAVLTDKANDQHYQVPTEFFKQVLGATMKYSCAYYQASDDLDQAQRRMLGLYIERADIQNGQNVLDLGCGWGAFSLFAAEKFPNSNFTGISNSATQKKYIDDKAKERGIKNLKIITLNVSEDSIPAGFDRIVSVEMVEHMRNYEALFSKLAKSLNQNGKMFIHCFVHKDTPYFFDVKDQTDWMSRYFFSGGTMPSEKLFYEFQDDLKIIKQWNVSGVHYADTSRDWVRNMDQNKSDIMKVLNNHYGVEKSRQWFNYWRVFFLSCEELWRFDQGKEWFVRHYLFSKE
jgi:cyclopropane-fatty-acyl-phospholipid synthase